MLKKLLPALFLLALIPSAAANGPTYSTRDLFISRCTGETATTGISRQSAANICACTYDTLRSRYTTAQWQQHINNDTNPDRDPVLNRRMNEAANTCVRRHLSR